MVTMYQLPYEWVRDQFAFNTEKYLHASEYTPTMGKGIDRKVKSADGVMVIGYRLPTEAEYSTYKEKFFHNFLYFVP